LKKKKHYCCGSFFSFFLGKFYDIKFGDFFPPPTKAKLVKKNFVEKRNFQNEQFSISILI